jgi:parallel beta-helix repeat protein
MNMRFAGAAAVIAIGLMLIGSYAQGRGRIDVVKVDVSSFGAIANDGKDDTAAVLAALERCQQSPPSVLVFPKGRYDFFAGSNPQDKNLLFSVRDLNDLTIEGQGSEFMIHGLTSVFTFINCRNLTIRDFTLDWDRPFFSTGKVLAVEGKHFDVDVFPEYPVKGGEPVGAYMDYDPETKLPMRHGVSPYATCEKTELIRPQVLRVYTKNPPPIKPGVLVVLRHQLYGPTAFHCSRCSDVKIQEVNVYHVPGMGFTASVCNNISLERFRVIPRPNSGHLMSATADATHFGGCTGTILMDGCVYEGMGDDGVNIKSGLYLSLKEKLDDHTILAGHNLQMIDAPDPGDEMEISHVDDLLAYAKIRVKKVEVLWEQKLAKVEFESPLPEELREGDVFGNATRTPKVRIRNTEVRRNRARGMLIQTRDAVIENCKFIRCTGPGIIVHTETVYFFESIGPRNVTVRNCLFEHCNYGVAMGPGALTAFAYLKDFKYPPKPGVLKDIVFEGNTIRGTDNSGIFVAGVDGITISKNTIEAACDDPTRDTGDAAIYLTGSSRVRIEGNTVEPKKQGAKFKEALKLGEGVDRSAAHVEGNKGF